MPAAKRRPRTYDPDKIRTAVITQFQNVRDAVRTLTPDQLALPTCLGDWTVREFVAHIAMTIEAVSRTIDQEPPAKAELSLPEWPFATAALDDSNTDRTRAFTREHPDLDALYASTEQRFAERLAFTPGERLLATRPGAMNLADYLVTRTVELVVHTKQAAVTALEDANRLRHSVYRRGRVRHLALLAERKLEIGHLDEACADWQRALDDFPHVQSGRCDDRFRAMLAALRRTATTPTPAPSTTGPAR
ncbi:maleylpyruvate isomerase N-terminal domain-containing protein [Streptomyces sp. KR55]|uniref:maleylpyruvate isomerase N-terminal domain-containing protein n=1 Tax=Streptomyces sp. KR55 TaxID=3457425 RepID=UPI003FD00B27